MVSSFCEHWENSSLLGTSQWYSAKQHLNCFFHVPVKCIYKHLVFTRCWHFVFSSIMIADLIDDLKFVIKKMTNIPVFESCKRSLLCGKSLPFSPLFCVEVFQLMILCLIMWVKFMTFLGNEWECWGCSWRGKKENKVWKLLFASLLFLFFFCKDRDAILVLCIRTSIKLPINDLQQ